MASVSSSVLDAIRRGRRQRYGFGRAARRPESGSRSVARARPDVRLNRLRRWHRPGLLGIGDAAHAMSPVFGIGINLAVEDAVAAARYLAEPLRTGTVGPREVRAVQRRRWPTAAATQALQRLVHAQVIEPVLAGRQVFGAGADAARPPGPVRIITTVPWLRRVPAYFLAYGALRERPPAASLR